jgi:hypothetical protein
MRAFFENKRWIIFLSLLALGALIVLAVGLRDISFRDAQPFSREQRDASRSVPLDMLNAVTDIPFWTQVSIFALLLGMTALIAILLSPELRKRLIKIVIRAALTCWALYLLLTRYKDLLANIGLNPKAAGMVPLTASNGAPIPEFTPPQTVSLAAYIVSFGIALFLAFILWKAYVFWKELAGSDSDLSLEKIAKIARTSLKDISSGRDSSDVIMNCYYRMSDVVADKQRLNRGAGMTPSEFALRLEQSGLPGEAVRTLTRLFERVRYGDHRSDPAEVKEAVTCLTSILHYCGETI